MAYSTLDIHDGRLIRPSSSGMFAAAADGNQTAPPPATTTTPPALADPQRASLISRRHQLAGFPFSFPFLFFFFCQNPTLVFFECDHINRFSFFIIIFFPPLFGFQRTISRFIDSRSTSGRWCIVFFLPPLFFVSLCVCVTRRRSTSIRTSPKSSVGTLSTAPSASNERPVNELVPASFAAEKDFFFSIYTALCLRVDSFLFF